MKKKLVAALGILSLIAILGGCAFGKKEIQDPLLQRRSFLRSFGREGKNRRSEHKTRRSGHL